MKRFFISTLFAACVLTVNAQGIIDPRRATADTCKISKEELCKRDSILAERKRQLNVDTIYIDTVTNDIVVGKNGNYGVLLYDKEARIRKRNPVILFSKNKQ